MGKPNYKLDLPPVLGPDNQPLSVEEAEASLREPEQIHVSFVRSGINKTYTVLADLSNVDGAAMDAYEVYTNRAAAVFAPAAKSRRNSKLTNLDEDESENQVTGEQLIKAAQMRPDQRHAFLSLIYPHDWEQNPVILASNLPEMPDEEAQIKAWFERGNPYADAVMEAVVMAIYPTGPLAQQKQNQARAEQLEAEMMETFREKMTEIQNLSLNPETTPQAETPETETPDEAADGKPLPAPNSTPPETGSESSKSRSKRGPTSEAPEPSAMVQ